MLSRRGAGRPAFAAPRIVHRAGQGERSSSPTSAFLSAPGTDHSAGAEPAFSGNTHRSPRGEIGRPRTPSACFASTRDGCADLTESRFPTGGRHEPFAAAGDEARSWRPWSREPAVPITGTPDELPAIDIHGLSATPGSRSHRRRRRPSAEKLRQASGQLHSRGEGRRSGNGVSGHVRPKRVAQVPLIDPETVAEVPLTGISSQRDSEQQGSGVRRVESSGRARNLRPIVIAV